MFLIKYEQIAGWKSNAKGTKYIVDIDSLIDSIECIRVMNINGDIWAPLKLVQEFIRRFPKDPIEKEEEAND